MVEMDRSRQRSEEYSESKVLPLARTPPTPMPVSKRQTASSHTLLVTAEASMPRLRIAVDAISTARRPKISATGDRKSEPSAIPARPAESRMPNVCGGTPHSLAISGAVKEIASTSKPSIMFRAVVITTIMI